MFEALQQCATEQERYGTLQEFFGSHHLLSEDDMHAIAKAVKSVSKKPEAEPAAKPDPGTKVTPKTTGGKEKPADEKQIREAGAFFENRVKELKEKSAPANKMYIREVKKVMRSRRWRLGENAKIEYDIVQTGAREMYEAYRDTIDEYGLEAARSVIEKSKSADIACMLRCAKHDAQKYMKKEEPMAIMVPEFGRAYMYWMLSEQFGGMVTDGQIRQEADYDKTVERAVEEYRSKYSSDDEMIRSTAKEYVRQTTQSIMMSRLGLMYEKAHKSKKLQKARRDAFESLRFLAENYDGIITVDELLAITKAYKPLVDPNPHKATGTINETNRNDDLVLRKVPHLDKKETPLERASMCNPHYGDKPYDNNCQCCVVTYEARARGYDATAGPAKWDHYWAQCFENADQIWLKSRFPDDRQAEIEKQMAEWGDGARAVVRVTWDDKSWGHVFVAEQIDGVTHYFEPQVPSAPNASEQTTHYFCDSMNVSLTRMDNLPMKDWAQTRVESRSV